tara:strand:- start:1072 stop:1527 length:456 start_codon:yes stop_codon:yes gene_type:complete
MKKKNYRTKIIEISSKLNSAMPIYVSNQIFNHLKKNNIKTKKILFVGIAYKKNTADTRESPSVDMIKRFLNKKFKIEFYDPIVKVFNLKNKLFRKKSIQLENIKKYKNEGFVIIGTDHKNINYKKILKNSQIIFDTRGVYNNYNSKKVIFV